MIDFVSILSTYNLSTMMQTALIDVDAMTVEILQKLIGPAPMVALMYASMIVIDD
jgi:hypothetical protein